MREDEVVFLALTGWREARGEPLIVEQAVVMCVLERVKHPGWWGKSVLEVIFKPLQFSSMTYPKDLQLVTWPRSGEGSWERSLGVARKALSGELLHPAPNANSYYDESIPAPKWATPTRFVVKYGRVRFYNINL